MPMRSRAACAASPPCASRAVSRLRSSLAPAEGRRARRERSPWSSAPYAGSNARGTHAGERLYQRRAAREALAAMSTAGRGSRVGAGRRRLRRPVGFGRNDRTTLSSSPRRRGSSGLFSGGSRVDSSSEQSESTKLHLRRRHPGRAISSCSWT